MLDIERRYQVFVSSTFEDLIEERREVSQALLELDCIPSGMELFPAADDDQWTLIKRIIDDCDYYLIILAGRYGTIGKQGKSYTEMEYRYALEQRKPIIAFLHKAPMELPVAKSENSTDGKEKLEKFRGLVKQKAVKFWGSSAELGSVVSRSIVNLIKSHPSKGWVKGDRILDDGSYKEILELRREIDRLRKEEGQNVPSIYDDKALLSGADLINLNCDVEFLDGDGKASAYDWICDISVDDLFGCVGPSLMDEASQAQLRRIISSKLIDQEWDSMRKDRVLKKMQFHSFDLKDHDLETILIQFLALGYIEKVKAKNILGENERTYKLTSIGEKILYRIRSLRKSKAEPL